MHHKESDKIRNIVLLSHSGAGKTSLTEAMLFNAGAISRLGKVDDGTTTSDSDPEEIKRKISINLSLLPCSWNDNKLNIIDTPGYPDFVGEVKAGLSVSEGAILVVCAVSGIEVGTEQVWEYSSAAALPRMIFINKMDRENANFADTLKEIQDKLGPNCQPIQLPIGSQKDFQGYVDIIAGKAYTGNPLKETEVPSNLSNEINSYRDKLIEAVVEIDDEVITRYLEGEELSIDEIYRCLKQSTAAGKVVPVLVAIKLIKAPAGILSSLFVQFAPKLVLCATVFSPLVQASEASIKSHAYISF